jgi:tetratricopeptide (TPR) repeat protein
MAALKLSPETEAGPLEKLRAKLANAFEMTEQRGEAIAMLEESTKQNPLRFDTFEFLGELYEKEGNLDRAIANYEHALLLDSREPRNYLRLTEMLLRTKKLEKAVETMKTARAKFRELPQVTLSLAMTLSQAKLHTEAMTAFAEAKAEAENSHEEMLTGTFYLQWGAAAEQAGLTDRAAELLRQSIALEPESAEAYNYLGYMWTDRGENLEEAGKLIQKALEIDPDNGAYIDSLGWYYYKTGDAERAVKELLRAAEIIKPEDPVVFDHLGDAYEKLGRVAEALTYWKKALALEKENSKIAEKIEAATGKVTRTTVVPAVP